MATFLLIRHAAHVQFGDILSGRSPGIELSPAGHAQAERIAGRIAAASPSHVQSSPVTRALATAAPIAVAAGLAVEPVAALDEIDFGTWTGRRFADLAGDPAWDDWNRARATARAPGGESMAEAQARIVEHLYAMAARCEGLVIAIVSHCDMIRAAVAHVLGLSLDHLLRFDIDPASLTRIELGAWGGRVCSLNEGCC